jgi:hypothetical protein
MSSEQINGISRRTVTVLSFIALLTVLTGYMQPTQADEGIGAHIFQLTIVLLMPLMLVASSSSTPKDSSQPTIQFVDVKDLSSTCKSSK